MFFSIVLFICALISNIFLRFVLRSGIKAKLWKKHAQGDFIRKWFLCDFYQYISNKVAFWIHIISSMSCILFFLLNVIAILIRIEVLEYIALTGLIISAFLSFDTFEVVWLLKGEKKGVETLVIRKTILVIFLVAITTFLGVVLVYSTINYLFSSI